MGNYVSKSTMADQQAEGKRTVTPQTIYNELAAMAKVDLVGWFVVSGVCVLFSGLFIFIFSMDTPLNETWTKIIKIALAALPVLIAVGNVFHYYITLKKMAKEDYDIIADKVERVVEDDKVIRRYTRHGVTYHMEHAMYLSTCGRVVISLQEVSTNSEGDIFYVIVAKKRPTRPILLYNSKYYDLQTSKLVREKLFAKSLSLKLSFQKLSKYKKEWLRPFLFLLFKVIKSWFPRNNG